MTRGMSLASVLMLVSLAAVAAFTMAALGSTHLNRAQHHAGAIDALGLAEAAVATTVSSLKANNRFGLADEEVRVQPDVGDATRYGCVSFDRSRDVFSTNNYQGMSTVGGWDGTVVPGGTVHLVATGSSHGVTTTLEVTVGVPQFPYVIAVAGALQSQGGLIVSGPQLLADVTRPPPGSASAGDASVASNDSITVASRAEITGDVVARGSVQLPPDAIVGGQIRTDTVDLPEIDLAQFDPSTRPGATLVTDSSSGPLTVNGSAYTAGNLVVGGNLRMNGVLYVRGSLTVNGALRGVGGVVVRGSTTVRSGVDLRGTPPAQLPSAGASNMIALLSEGDVTLSGPGTTSYFEGLVYTHGNFTARNITILGTFVASPGASSPTGGRMDLDNVRVVQVPQASSLTVTLGTTEGARVATELLTADQYPVAIAQSWSSGSGAPFVKAVADYPPGTGPWSGYGVPQSNAYSADRKEILDAMRPVLSGRPWRYAQAPDEEWAAGRGWAFLGRMYLPLSDGRELWVEVPSMLRVDAAGTFSTAAWSALGVVTSTRSSTSSARLTRQQAAELANREGVSLDEMIQSSVDLQNMAVYQANVVMKRYRDSGVIPAGDAFDFSLNRFLRDTTPMRILSWRRR